MPSTIHQYLKSCVSDAREGTVNAVAVDQRQSEASVFYPGAGFDGQPVKLFNSAGVSTSFVYADSGLSRQEILDELNDSIRGFRGYAVTEAEDVRTPHQVGDWFKVTLTRQTEFDEDTGLRISAFCSASVMRLLHSMHSIVPSAPSLVRLPLCFRIIALVAPIASLGREAAWKLSQSLITHCRHGCW